MTKIDDTKLNEFLGKVVADVGSAMSAALVVIGDELGLWRALAAATEPMSPTELAHRTETSERYLREWLNAMAAGGYVTYDKDSQTYGLEPEQAVALADSNSPAFVPGLFQVTAAMWAARAKVGANFRTGAGLAWGHQHPCLFEGTERFFRSGYLGNLIQSWLPALDGVVEKLERGARWRMSAAASALRPLSWRRRIPSRRSSASTRTRARSRWLASGRARLGSPTG